MYTCTLLTSTSTVTGRKILLPVTTGGMVTGILKSTKGAIEKIVNSRCHNKILITNYYILSIIKYGGA